MILKALDRDAAEGRPVRGEMARELREALAESSPEQMLSQAQIENIARKVYRECCLLPGATFHHAAEVAVMYTLELIARRQGAEPECGNCFEGKSDMDHMCRKCGGSGKAEPAPAQDEDIYEGTYTHLCELLEPHTVGAGGQLPASVCDAFRVMLDAFLARPAQTEQQPVAFRVLRRNHDGIWTTDGRAWVDGVPNADLLGDIAERSDQWQLEYAYAAPIAQTAPPKGPNWKRRSQQGWATAAMYRAENQELKARLQAQTAPQPEQSGLASAVRAYLAAIDNGSDEYDVRRARSGVRHALSTQGAPNDPAA